jgi:hypothetical protein
VIGYLHEAAVHLRPELLHRRHGERLPGPERWCSCRNHKTGRRRGPLIRLVIRSA